MLLNNKVKMNVSEFIEFLGSRGASEVVFYLNNGTVFSPHFHISFISKVDKTGFTCEKIPYAEAFVEIQLWVADDVNHRISGDKFLSILSKLDLQAADLLKDLNIQLDLNGVLSSFSLRQSEGLLVLNPLKASCPVPELCVVDNVQEEVNSGACKPGSGCC